MRADEALVKLGLSPSRTKAREVIEEGVVFIIPKDGGEKIRVDKPSRKIPEGAELRLEGDAAAQKFVSRAGLKLEGFIKKFGLDLNGARILDAGASTGGFTDCALLLGATHADCVDVGTGQLHPKIANDPRVKNYEKTDVRILTPEFFDGELFDFICADLSFISLEKVLPILWKLLKNGGKIVCLVKPQFESTPEIMHKNHGVLKDDAIRLQILDKIRDFCLTNFSDATEIGEMESVIAGGDGNREFLIGLEKNAN